MLHSYHSDIISSESNILITDTMPSDTMYYNIRMYEF